MARHFDSTIRHSYYIVKTTIISGGWALANEVYKQLLPPPPCHKRPHHPCLTGGCRSAGRGEVGGSEGSPRSFVGRGGEINFSRTSRVQPYTHTHTHKQCKLPLFRVKMCDRSRRYLFCVA